MTSDTCAELPRPPKVIVQKPVPGTDVFVWAVFNRGELLSFAAQNASGSAEHHPCEEIVRASMYSLRLRHMLAPRVVQKARRHVFGTREPTRLNILEPVANEAVVRELGRSLRIFGRDSGYTGMIDFDFRGVLESPTASPASQAHVQCWAIECNPRFPGAFWQMEEMLKGDVLKSYFELLFSGQARPRSSAPWGHCALRTPVSQTSTRTSPSTALSEEVASSCSDIESRVQKGLDDAVDPAYENVLSRIEPVKWGADPAKFARDVGPWFFSELGAEPMRKSRDE